MGSNFAIFTIFSQAAVIFFFPLQIKDIWDFFNKLLILVYHFCNIKLRMHDYVNLKFWRVVCAITALFFLDQIK